MTMTNTLLKPALQIPLLLLFFSLISLSQEFKFNQNGEFTVLQFTDFHYCESEERDDLTLALQKRLLNIVKPDLVVVSGDAVSGFRFDPLTDEGFFEKCWQKFTQPFVDSQTYYAYTLGNHDAEADLDRTQVVQLDKTNPYSVLKTAEGIPDAATYRIPVYSSQNQSQLAANIWVLDSGSYGCGEDQYSWGCIQEYDLDWYDHESRMIKEQYGTNVHHVAFYHIPIPEYRYVYNYEEIYGEADDNIGCPSVNTGFFSRIQRNGDISAMFVGHDHNNDFAGWYEGVEFVYGRKSGYGSYGNARGARIIKFKEITDGNGQTVVTREHYIIEEDGEIITAKETRTTGWSKKLFCLPANGGVFAFLLSIGFFEFFKNFVIAPLICFFIWKHIVRDSTQPKSKKSMSPLTDIEMSLIKSISSST